MLPHGSCTLVAATGHIMTMPQTREEQDRAWHLTEHERKANPEYVGRLLAPLNLRDGCTFVDVGCGGGYVNAYVAMHHSARLNLGLDLFLDTVVLARHLSGQAGSNWLAGSAEALPLRSASVDCLVCRGVVPLADVRKVVSEIARVLRPGGTCVLLLHSWSYYLEWLSLNPRHWKRAAAGMIHTMLGLWFNLTGKQVVIRAGNRRIGQTYQTVYRMRRILSQLDMTVYSVKRRPEMLLYVRKERKPA